MPANCVAYGCKNWFSGPQSLRLFRFPSEKRYPERRAAWIRAVKRVNPDGSPWQPSAYSRICGAHFINGCPSNLAKHPDYVPSIFNYTRSRGASAVHRWKRDRTKSTNSHAVSQLLNIKTEPVDARCPQTIPASSCQDATNSHAVSQLLNIKTEPVDAPCPRTIPASSCQDATNSDTMSQQLSIKTEPVDAPCLPANSCQNEEFAGTSGSPTVGSQEMPAADDSSYGVVIVKLEPSDTVSESWEFPASTRKGGADGLGSLRDLVTQAQAAADAVPYPRQPVGRQSLQGRLPLPTDDKWLEGLDLPQFSEEVQPLLHGGDLTREEHHRLSKQFRREIIDFLNNNNLISDTSSGGRRWKYHYLGLTLASCFPKLQWDFRGPRASHNDHTRAKSRFLSKLAEARRHQHARAKIREVTVHTERPPQAE